MSGFAGRFRTTCMRFHSLQIDHPFELDMIQQSNQCGRPRRSRLGARALICLVVAALALGGCATQAVTRSGFLNSYDNLVPESSQSKNLVSRPAPGVLARYDAVYVDPVEVRISTKEDKAAMDEVAALAAQALRKELAADWTIADSPRGIHTLRVRTALTAVKTSNPALNIVLFILLPVPLDNGGLSAESEFVDASSGQLVGAVVWAGQGLWDPVGYFSPYGHPRQLTEGLAKAIAAVLRRDCPFPLSAGAAREDSPPHQSGVAQPAAGVRCP